MCFYRFGDVPVGFLQVLLHEFTLTREDRGIRLDVSISDDGRCIVDLAGKAALAAEVTEEARSRITERLSWFYAENDILSYRFKCPDCCFRYANGGVLPIVQFRSEDYFCLFYRDIDPIGWNIANGASDQLDELLNPEKLLFREFREELLILDGEDRLIYKLDAGDEEARTGPQRRALREWISRLEARGLHGLKDLSRHVGFVYGPDQVHATMGNSRETTGGYFLSVTPNDNAIEVDRVAVIGLRDDECLLDGEIREHVLFNRVIGLFRVGDFNDRRLHEEAFRPNLMFFDGELFQPPEAGSAVLEGSILDDAIRKYLDGLKELSDYHSRSERYDAQMKRFDLCPITRAVIGRYLGWQKRPISEEPAGHAGTEPPLPGEAQECQVFISYNSKDVGLARWLYSQLVGRGVKVFCSAESLARIGETRFMSAIYTALDSATCLIVLGTHPDYFASRWVTDEWQKFQCEINSARKPANSKLLVFDSGMESRQLPLGLRDVELIRYCPSSPRESFERLYQFVRGAVDEPC